MTRTTCTCTRLLKIGLPYSLSVREVNQVEAVSCKMLGRINNGYLKKYLQIANYFNLQIFFMYDTGIIYITAF